MITVSWMITVRAVRWSRWQKRQVGNVRDDQPFRGNTKGHPVKRVKTAGKRRSRTHGDQALVPGPLWALPVL